MEKIDTEFMKVGRKFIFQSGFEIEIVGVFDGGSESTITYICSGSKEPETLSYSRFEELVNQENL